MFDWLKSKSARRIAAQGREIREINADRDSLKRQLRAAENMLGLVIWTRCEGEFRINEHELLAAHLDYKVTRGENQATRETFINVSPQESKHVA